MIKNNNILPEPPKYPLFSVVGIELEYMIVDRNDLNVCPIADILLQKLAAGDVSGKIPNEVELGEIAINNEMVLHVIELKTNGPKKELKSLANFFHHEIKYLNTILNTHSACLMPTGAHPWYDPDVMMKLWPYEDQEIYHTFHRVFNCAGHGWSNLQSMQINLPFANDEEFSKLHNAIRLLMSLIPALTASTPFINGKKAGFKDTRLNYYGKSQQTIPIIPGEIIPEFIVSQEDYNKKILNPIYQAVAPFDPEELIQYEWLNSRGAIARFDRSAIEIRIIDSQECPLADISCAAAIVGALKYLVYQTDTYHTNPIDTTRLRDLYNHVIRNGFDTSLEGWSDYLDSFHFSGKKIFTAREFWRTLLEKSALDIDAEYQSTLDTIITHGNLAERLLSVTTKENNLQSNLESLYGKLCESLNQNQLFLHI